ncbi:receptor-type tyrosine-protein phosphatase kappa [Elysia marginata]|uniref:protein-tyrosine-phosphatase n=1 Tax=Elysia marginata TaxID=1093978 RepID=A0AAV4JIX7_9GAST|nr:receptor-type tyrosine-protein phosphatase kappa [Elysia marginata]
MQGCAAGFSGPMCTQRCFGSYGRNCSTLCGKCLNGTVCDTRNGHCKLGCEPGFTSSDSSVKLCDQMCQGRYGKNCYGKCGECKGKSQCDRITGECPDGCQSGFTSKLCNRICDSHYYGFDCAQRCGRCKDNQTCNPFTGGCSVGCVEDHTGFLCIQRIAKDDGPSAAVLFGAGAGVAIASVLILLLLCYAYKKRRHKHLHMSKADRTVEYFDDHITRGESCQLLGDSRVGITVFLGSAKFWSSQIFPKLTAWSLPKLRSVNCKLRFAELLELPMGLLAQCDIARKPENKSKNRYGNIVAYDHSRVVLEPLPNEPFSDYVNANFMDGYGRKQMYIASQGPNKVMIRDFWRMVWQHRVSKIVMLTNLIEACKKKCEQYWPDEGTQKYGDLSVFLVNATKYSDFIIRTFELSKENENSRIVIQFHFTTWSDHGAPTYPTTLLAFRRKVINFKPEDTAPILSHCSAGIGRTGTFIAMNYLLEQAQAEGVVDVLKCAQQMRVNRVNMIQTLEQYVFVYDAVLEAILAAVTTISRSNFHSKFEEMLNGGGQQETPMERQYNVLQQLSPTIEREECSAALQEENMAKNRFKNILPANRNRTFLQTPVEGCNDYINAVYLSSYTQKDQFIVTQMPLPTTLADFWRMMYDTGSSTIIMLNEFDRNDKSCALYWPEEYGYCETYSPLSVELLSSSDVDPDVTIRVFKLSHLEKNEERAIKQFMLKSWPDYQTTPCSTTSLLRLHCSVNDWLKQISKGPVTIHCMNGASKSGVLVATSLLLERLELDYEVDVYQTVKQIRINRPQFIENLEQYTFLYQIVQDYLDQE